MVQSGDGEMTDNRIGRRIRYRAHFSNTDPDQRSGSGIVIDVPPRDHYGCSVKVRFDDGREVWLSSLAQIRYLERGF